VSVSISLSIHLTVYVYHVLCESEVCVIIYMCFEFVLILCVFTLIAIMIMSVYVHIYVRVYMMWVGCHLPSLRGTPLITLGERERTHALHGELLYPTTSFAAPDASARASVGAPQSLATLCESLFSLLSLIYGYACMNYVGRVNV